MMSCAVAHAVEMMSEDECRAFLVRRFHPAGAHCPSCGVLLVASRVATWQAGMRVCCAGCGKTFDWRSGTLICGWVADARQIVLMLVLMSGRCLAGQIAAATGLTESTVRNYRRRFAEAAAFQGVA